MAWIEVHQALTDHRKVTNASALLGRGCSPTLVVGHLVTLWCWAIDSAQDGGPLTAVEIANGARWRKDAEVFAKALHLAGLIDQLEDGYWLHDWADYAGRLIGKRKANTERMRSARASNVQRTTGARAAHVQGLPNSTEQHRTKQDSTEPPDKNPPTPRTRITAVDAEFRRAMVERFEGKVSADRVNAEIDDALGHKAAEKRNDKQAYVRIWLTRAFEERNGAPARTYGSQFEAGDPRQPKPINHGVYEHLVNRGA